MLYQLLLIKLKINIFHDSLNCSNSEEDVRDSPSQATRSIWPLFLGFFHQETVVAQTESAQIIVNCRKLMDPFSSPSSILHLSNSLSHFSETLISIHYWSTQKLLGVHSEFRIKSKFFNIMFKVYFLPTSLRNPKHTRHIPETMLLIIPLTSIWSIPPLAPMPGSAPISFTIPS